MSKKKTKEEFIKEATEKHEGKYDYSKVDYVKNNIKVCIICPKPEHGEFWQRPNSHLSGYGCPRCGKTYSPTKEEWITSAREVHEGKYDYSNVKYVNSATKVCIICPKPEHGEFWQRPADHTNGQGCPKCKGDKTRERCRLSKEDFIKKANEVHEGKYNYTKVKYENNRTKVCIICPEHDEFWQTPADHTNGQGCPKCKGDKTRERCRLSKEDFIKKANEVHEGKYNYTKVKYENNRTKVCIICPEHDEFWQTPADHTNGQGCPKCKGDKNSEIKTLTKEEWIKKVREKHGDKYDYSNVNYVGSHTKVCIICPEHGEFYQKPFHHTNGHGCPKCNLSHLERNVMKCLDDIGITYDYQKRFKWLGRQSLDFYLPDYNVSIECQGGQHFFPVEHFGGDKGFKNTLERDKRKKKLCEENGIKLLYFGKTPKYDTFLGEVVHDDVQYLIDYLNEHKKQNRLLTIK